MRGRTSFRPFRPWLRHEVLWVSFSRRFFCLSSLLVLFALLVRRMVFSLSLGLASRSFSLLSWTLLLFSSIIGNLVCFVWSKVC